MWVCLNARGKRVWGKIFADGKVPVCSSFQEVTTAEGRNIHVVLVDWHVLSDAQFEAVLKKLSRFYGVSKQEIMAQILDSGLPLRQRFTTGEVVVEVRFFV